MLPDTQKPPGAMAHLLLKCQKSTFYILYLFDTAPVQVHLLPNCSRDQNVPQPKTDRCHNIPQPETHTIVLATSFGEGLVVYKTHSLVLSDKDIFMFDEEW